MPDWLRWDSAGQSAPPRRAVAQVKAAWRAGHRRSYQPWITEPGLWLQSDWGQGPRVLGPGGQLRKTLLFCAWLAWSRFRVVIPVWDPRPGLPEASFLALGQGAAAWLVEASAVGTVRIRAKMATAVELADLVIADESRSAQPGTAASADSTTLKEHSS